MLPEGGSNALAAVGAAAIPAELPGLGERDVVCCPVGTGGTLAGIAAGLPAGARALGVAVLRGGEGYLEAEVTRLHRAAYGRGFGNWRIDHGHHGGGYGRVPAELADFAERFERRHGIALERRYVAKLLAALADLAGAGAFPAAPASPPSSPGSRTRSSGRSAHGPRSTVHGPRPTVHGRQSAGQPKVRLAHGSVSALRVFSAMPVGMPPGTPLGAVPGVAPAAAPAGAPGSGLGAVTGSIRGPAARKSAPRVTVIASEPGSSTALAPGKSATTWSAVAFSAGS